MPISDDGHHKIENEIICPSCHSHFFITKQGGKQLPHFCSFCGTPLQITSEIEGKKSYPSLSYPSSDSLVEEVIPQDKVQFSIGPYQIIKEIGKGGMGEVFLAYDDHLRKTHSPQKDPNRPSRTQTALSTIFKRSTHHQPAHSPKHHSHLRYPRRKSIDLLHDAIC